MLLSKVIDRPTPERYAELRARFIAPDGSWRVLPASAYESVTFDEFRFICQAEALYGCVTTELVEWLRERLAGERAIEVGSGKAGLGRAVGIRMTDADVQSRPDQILYYGLLGQPTIVLPRDVVRIDALRAVKKYRPTTVVGMWVTQKHKPHMSNGTGASVYGIDELKLLKRVRRYIVIGNDAIHGDKEILGLRHETYRFPWLLSRRQHGNAIYVWER